MKRYRYRSKFEAEVAKRLREFEYESKQIRYTVPARDAVYTPDFILPNGVIVEAKGRFTSEDRKKHLLVKQQHPELDIRLLFMRPNLPIRKGSRTTVADWCDKHGIKWAAGPAIPKEWKQ